MFLIDLLTLPVLGPCRGVAWLAETIAQEAQQELVDDEERVRSDLLELQTLYELGEVSEEDCAQREATLLERLEALRQAA